MEGTIEQRVTKLSKAKRLIFAENFFRIGKIKVINTWREDLKPLPATVCTNLTRHVGWTKASARELPIGEDSTIEIGPNDIPTSKREEEVDENDTDETSENQLSDETKLEATGRVMIVPDATNNETATESMNNIRIMNDNLNDDASSDMSEISEDEPQTGATVRKLMTSHPDDRLTDEKAEQTLKILKRIIQGNTAGK